MSSRKDNKALLSRRTIFKAGLVSGIAMPITAFGQSPNRMRPQQGDQLVFDEGDRIGELIGFDMLELEQQPLSALAKDPDTETIRDGSRLNRVMIMKLDEEKLNSRFQVNAAEGIVAYSAVCTHTGCDVINWDEGLLRMACPCHESQFDVYDGAKNVGGPAPRPLAMLPLEIVDGIVTVAGAFKGRVGFTQDF
jgi:rieske iron-sulfur protein